MRNVILAITISTAFILNACGADPEAIAAAQANYSQYQANQR